MKYPLRSEAATCLLCGILLFAPTLSLGGIGGRCTGKDDTCTAPPRVIYSPPPDYSERARKASREGTCTLLLIVGADGHPSDIRVLVGLGMGLDEKAIEAVQRWKFEPAMRAGKPVAAKAAVEVDFHLSGMR
jgi:TonB family protein